MIPTRYRPPKRSAWRAVLSVVVLAPLGCIAALTPEIERSGVPLEADTERSVDSEPESVNSSRPESESELQSGSKESAPHITIDLATALQLASDESIDVAILREHIEAAKAELDMAHASFLPQLRVGVDYLRTDGHIQSTPGLVFNGSRSTLRAIPMLTLSIDPGQAAFDRLRAKQLVKASEEGKKRGQAEAMIRVASLYHSLVASIALREVAHESTQHTQAQVDLDESLVEIQAKLKVHLARSRAALARDQQRLIASEERIRRLSVALAVELRLPPETRLVPVETDVLPVQLIDPDSGELDSLYASSRGRRPDIMELSFILRAAEEDVTGATWTPWIPEVSAFAGYGLFGGGGNGFVGNFGDRVDVGIGISWTFKGLGFGDMAHLRRKRATTNVAKLQFEDLWARAEGELISTREKVRSLDARLEAARRRIEAASEALTLISERYQSGDAIQLEVLEAIGDRAQAQAELVRATTEYNQAQYLLYYLVHGSAWNETKN